ncbi:hypothetical protein CC86DRAFT_325049 [Ophiobolus disseminans]|uniref:BZIP domain-containing protein n=1 Tax=Ophiobolus disseminans TaxID=1469910 RepID=A0A6A6ZVW0_9PLEO|nr:hypothetical protein CC86DRAFT_325049 [Ophiobolus disseminans]
MKFRFKPFQGAGDHVQAHALGLSCSIGISTGFPSCYPQARRKDQVRRAQRTHRERKLAYTKSLENEVIQLRANEARILQETKALYSEISMLRNVLNQNSIPIPNVRLQSPEEAQNDNRLDTQLFNLSIQKPQSKQDHQRITVHRNVSNNNERWRESTTAGDSTNNIANASNSSNFTHPVSTLNEAPRVITRPSATPVEESDITAIGMDFVLTLESPCLSHNVPANHDASTGHALTASAALLHHHPAPLEQRLQSSQKVAWEVPAAGIEQLLQLSASVPLFEGELTPVQAWDRVRRHPEFGKLEVERLERMKYTLLKAVKCYGFGGVIDQLAFDGALFDTFVVGRVF